MTILLPANLTTKHHVSFPLRKQKHPERTFLRPLSSQLTHPPNIPTTPTIRPQNPIMFLLCGSVVLRRHNWENAGGFQFAAPDVVVLHHKPQGVDILLYGPLHCLRLRPAQNAFLADALAAADGPRVTCLVADALCLDGGSL